MGNASGERWQRLSKFASRAISKRRLEKMEPKRQATNKNSAKCHRILYHCTKALSREVNPSDAQDVRILISVDRVSHIEDKLS